MSNGDLGYIINLDPYLESVLAVLDVLQAAGLIPNLDPLQFIFDAFDGKPKLEDTELAALRLQASPWWPLRALGSNLQIWVKNGVPLSTGKAPLRAQLSEWIRGTIDSIEPIVYGRFNPYSLDHAIWLSMTSEQGDTAIVQLNNTIAEQHALGPLPQVPGSQPTTPPPFPDVGARDDPNDDELGDYQQTLIFQNTIIYDRLVQIATELSKEGQGDCCVNVVKAIAAITGQLSIIAAAVAGGLDGSNAIDLGPLTAAVQALVTAVSEYPPALEACCSAISNNLSAIATALGPDLGKVIQNIADAINSGNTAELMPAAMIHEMVKNGSLPAPIAQFFSDRPAGWSISGLLSGIGHFLTGQLNPELGNQVVANINAVSAGTAPPYQPFHSLLDVALGPLIIIGIWWGKIAVNISADLMPVAQTVLANIGQAIGDVIPGGLGGVPPGVGAPAVAALNFVMSAPAPGEIITVKNYSKIFQDAMGRAGLMGMTAWAAAMVGGLVLGPWEKYWGEVAAMIATAAGFKEITPRALDPFLDAIIHNRAYQDANQKWPTRVPPAPQGLALWSRRKISDPQRDLLLGYGGLDPDWRPAMEAGAYRPLQPRVVVNAFLDQPIDRPTLVALLEDAALSPANVQTMADAIIYKSIANVRNSYLSALISGYGKGVISDQELSDALTQFNFAAEARQYVTAHVLILRREVLAAEAEKTVVPLVANGNISADEGLQQLEAAGVQPWYAELQITLATTRATIHAAKLEAAAERKAELARQRNLTRAAVAEYQSGAIDAAALTAALLVLGLDASLVASIVAVQTATRQGRLRLVYGQLLSPGDAKLLTEKVAAIAQQTKDQLITLDQAQAQLAALNVDQAEAEALVARWAATLKKSPGAAVLLTP